MSNDHNPDGPEENTRIYAAGGYVTEENRICGNLNLSRALGDHRYTRLQTTLD
jgi:serine/threonine protein phosphatase PrpC